MTGHRLLLSVVVVALLSCPIACFGGGLAHEHDCTTPKDGGEHPSCISSSCVCAGATRPSTDQAIVGAIGLPLAVVPVADPTDRASLKLGAYVAGSMPIPDPPRSCGTLPLLI